MEWTKYTTKEALKDNDELMILDKDANANKRTLMDKVWNYVVDKMTTAVIAKLGTTNKTLIGAVNELNSNSFEKNVIPFKVENGKYINEKGDTVSYSPYSIIYVPITNGCATIFSNLSDSRGTRHELWNAVDNKMISYQIANPDRTYSVSVPKDEVIRYVKLSNYNVNGLPKQR